MSDNVNHPQHYTGHASGVECIEITENMPFAIGNSCKYVFRRNDKWDTTEDLAKARWYAQRHIDRGLTQVWLGSLGDPGRDAIMRVIEHEPPSHVRDFYVGLFRNDPRGALAALDREIADVEFNNARRSRV